MHYFSLVPQAKTAIVACLIGGQKYVSYVLERDEEMIRQLLEMEETFYQCCVTDTPPAMEVVEGPQESYDMDPDVETVVEEYLEKKRALEVLTKDVDALKSALISLVGENRTQTGPRYQVAYSYVKQSRVDVDRLCAENNLNKKEYMSDGGYFKLVAKERK
jgi:predicted phage-related endonuclease